MMRIYMCDVDYFVLCRFQIVVGTPFMANEKSHGWLAAFQIKGIIQLKKNKNKTGYLIPETSFLVP